MEEPGREVVGVRVARILEVTPHPDADRLQLADVEDGDGTTRVVCGAWNIAPGQLVPFAPAGARLPGGLTLERRTIRGQASDGMLCSPRELGLGDDHEGILILDTDAEPGTDVRALLGLDDVVFDLSITPNRPDAMCITGVAREIAAHLGQPFAIPPGRASGRRDRLVRRQRRHRGSHRCPRYLARVARVTLGASPAWMQQRLVKAGMRPISNVVDVTNYVLLERNQPLHAFDLERLAGRGIVVRLARTGERMTTLDGVERELDDEDLLICDAERAPQAIAGIMGGSTSEVSADTTEVLLESAYFERMGIARSSKRLRLRSESSARFERGIDPDGVAVHAARAMDLLEQVAAAAVAPDAVDEYPEPHVRPRIRLRTSRVNRILGTTVTDDTVLAALRPLEIEVDGSGDELTATPPSFRPDLEREIDLVEEVARRIGFESIGRTVPKAAEQVGGLTPSQRERRRVADALVGAGAAEVMALPLVSPALLADFGLSGAVAAHEPVAGRRVRAAHGPGPGPRAHRGPQHGPRQPRRHAVRARHRVLPARAGRRAAGGARARGRARRGLGAAGPGRAGPARRRLRRGRSRPGRPRRVGRGVRRARVRRGARVAIRPRRAGRGRRRAGRLRGPGGSCGGGSARHRGDGGRVRGRPGCPHADAARRDRMYVPPSPFPPSTIDLAFVLDEAVPAAAVAATLRDAGGDTIESIHVFDEFRRSELGAGRRSVAFNVRFRAADRTLTDAELAQLRQRCIDAVVAAHGAELRG